MSGALAHAGRQAYHPRQILRHHQGPQCRAEEGAPGWPELDGPRPDAGLGSGKRAKCLFCEWIGPWQEGYVHVCSECPAFAQLRQDVVDAAPTSWLASRPDPRVWWAVLQAVPGARHFPAAVALAAEVEARAAALGKAEDTVAAQA